MESGSLTIPDSAGTLDVAWATDTGAVRARNEDRCVVVPLVGGGCVLVLADGMGGHSGGAEAAEAAVSAVGAAVSGRTGIDAAMLEVSIAAAVVAVSAFPASVSGSPGTTLDVVGLVGGEMIAAHVGDARVYAVTAGRARCLTIDHSWVGEEIRAGRLDASAARGHPRRNIITRAITGSPVAPDVTGHAAPAPGETVFLCSDGVWEPLEDDELGALIGGGGDLESLVVATCRAAIDGGSRDNVTVAAARRR